MMYFMKHNSVYFYKICRKLIFLIHNYCLFLLYIFYHHLLAHNCPHISNILHLLNIKGNGLFFYQRILKHIFHHLHTFLECTFHIHCLLYIQGNRVKDLIVFNMLHLILGNYLLCITNIHFLTGLCIC